MRRKLLPLALILCLLLTLPALAQQANLSAVPAVLTLPEGVYAPILMPDNLEANASFITGKGGTVAAWQEMFKQQGILLQAYDDKNDRVLVVTAVSDADGQQYVDIDQHSPAERANYRARFQKGSELTPPGYTFDSAEWKNFPDVGRFLMGRYTYRENGEIHHRGFLRRSVKNGLTIVVDMQVYGRALKGGDNTALNKVFDTLSFTGTAGAGLTLPVIISETMTAPTEAYEPTFRMKGTTRPGAVFRATVMSFATNKADVYNAVADTKGAYSFDITLPAEGFYMITMEVEAEGLEKLEKQYTVTYARGLLPVEILSPLPENLSQNSYRIAGKTLAGVTVQMLVNGQSTTRRTPANGSFAFTVNTRDEGIYEVELTFSKRDFNSKTISYNAVKGPEGPAPLPSQAPVQSGDMEALSPTYTDLIAKADEYADKRLTYHGYITKVEQKGEEYIISLATRKTSSGYADTVLLIASEDPKIEADREVIIYGTLAGINADLSDSTILGYPRIQLQSIALAPEASQ